jgi:hypothetical protein
LAEKVHCHQFRAEQIMFLGLLRGSKLYLIHSWSQLNGCLPDDEKNHMSLRALWLKIFIVNLYHLWSILKTHFFFCGLLPPHIDNFLENLIIVDYLQHVLYPMSIVWGPRDHPNFIFWANKEISNKIHTCVDVHIINNTTIRYIGQVMQL